jgi:cytochrome d ubiquinol oxidase subunit I
MNMDTLELSRMQFAPTSAFTSCSPPSTLRCAGSWCTSACAAHAAAGTPAAQAWEQAYYFWTKVFALSFALGVVSASP